MFRILFLKKTHCKENINLTSRTPVHKITSKQLFLNILLLIFFNPVYMCLPFKHIFNVWFFPASSSHKSILGDVLIQVS